MAALEVGIPGGAVTAHERPVEHRRQTGIAAARILKPLHEVGERLLQRRQLDG